MKAAHMMYRIQVSFTCDMEILKNADGWNRQDLPTTRHGSHSYLNFDWEERVCCRGVGDAWSSVSAPECMEIIAWMVLWLKVASIAFQGLDCDEGCCRAVRDARSHGGVDKWRHDDSDQETLRQSIKSAVNEMFDKHNEVPFLAMYRKHVSLLSPCSRTPPLIAAGRAAMKSHHVVQLWLITLKGPSYLLKGNHTRQSYGWRELAPVDVVQPSSSYPALVQVLGELLCGRAEDMPDVIKRESSRLPTGLSIGMVQVSGVFPVTL